MEAGREPSSTLSAPNRTEWESASSTLPEFLIGPVYDPSDSVLLGVTIVNTGTWSYNGTWSELNLSLEPSCGQIVNGFLASDTRDGYVLAALQGSEPPQLCAWKYSDHAWSELPGALPITNAEGLAYDAGLDRFVLVSANETWVYQAGNWTDISSSSAQPPESEDPGLAYDPSDNYTVFFGGSDPITGDGITSTWALQGEVWTNISNESATHPPADWVNTTPASPFDTAMAFDPVDDYIVLLAQNTRGFPATTWTFLHGLWTNISWRLPEEPPFGIGLLAYYPLNDSLQFWSQDAGVWVYVHYGALQVTGFTFRPDVIDAGMTSQVVVSWEGGLSPYLFNYSGLPRGCLNYDGPSFYCTPQDSGVYTVGVNVSDWVGEFVNSSTSLVVHPALYLSSLQLSRSLLDVGQSLSLSMTVRNGTAPYSYQYSGLPPGCTSQNQSAFTCSPNGSGSFTVLGEVTDLTGSHQLQSALLKVLPEVRIESFEAAPEGFNLSANTTLTVEVLGGTGTFSYSYSGLPTGCANRSAPTIVCTPTVTGNFTVQVVVADGLGGSARANLTLQVRLPTAPSTGLPQGSWLPLIGFAVVAAGAVVIAAAWLRRRRARAREIGRAESFEYEDES